MSEELHGMIDIGWEGGTIQLEYTAVPSIDQSASDTVASTVQQFARECQMMFVWYVGVLQGREAMLRHMDAIAPTEEVTFRSRRPDGTYAARARASREEVIGAFSQDGSFQNLYGKAFVVFAYQIWEDFTRPRIAEALKVLKDDVRADLMGEWRLLRNWVVHQTQKAERDFFDGAPELARSLNLQAGMPEITGDMVAALMEKLNSLRIDVNPLSQPPAFERVPLPPAVVEAIRRKAEEQGVGMAVVTPSGLIPIASPGPDVAPPEQREEENDAGEDTNPHLALIRIRRDAHTGKDHIHVRDQESQQWVPFGRVEASDNSTQ